jgi:glycosyltransferase involved in cell wall biosynthesis
MKKNHISVFALPSHTDDKRISGVDFIRIIQPMQHLGKQEGFEVEIFDAKEKTPTHWSHITEQFDIIYFNYLTHDWGYAAMGMLARKHDVKIVMDLDDNLWSILPDNSAYQTFKKGSKGLHVVTSIINDVDKVTCTNLYLKNAIVNNTYKRHEFVKVFPNYIDLDLYKYRLPFREMPDIVIGHFGSTTHFTSLQNEAFAEAMDKLMYEYPNIKFRTIGSFFGEYKRRWGARYEYAFGDVDVLEWIKKMPNFLNEIDIIVAPLTDNLYNRAKSSCKYLETSSFIKPGVWEKIRQYETEIDDGIDGFLASTKEEWYEKLKLLIDNKNLRKTMGENAFEKVKKYHQIQDHIQEYADFFKQILD